MIRYNLNFRLSAALYCRIRQIMIIKRQFPISYLIWNSIFNSDNSNDFYSAFQTLPCSIQILGKQKRPLLLFAMAEMSYKTWPNMDLTSSHFKRLTKSFFAYRFANNKSKNAFLKQSHMHSAVRYGHSHALCNVQTMCYYIGSYQSVLVNNYVPTNTFSHSILSNFEQLWGIHCGMWTMSNFVVVIENTEK